MPEPAVQQLVEALYDLEAFSVRGRGGGWGLPQLPAGADDALVEHLAKGLQIAARMRGGGPTAVSPAEIQTTTQELRAAVALLQEWVVRP
jgi:hypothetical protein